ncbi:MAG TPA: carbohydrate binding domain-containing protein [Bryobacteraceae bacterium]
MKAAVLLVPGNADYHALLAEHMEGAGLDPDGELAKATEVSPRESRFWIRRAFRAEVEKKLDDSERFLRQAVHVDTGFAPRAALMNYYFRRQNLPEFWKAARAALQTAYTDRREIFRLCFAVDDNVPATRALLPSGHRPLVELLSFLMTTGRLTQAEDIASAVAAEAEPDDLNLLLGYVEQQTGKNDSTTIAVWNALCSRHLVPFSPLSPGEGNIVTNGDFESNIHRGFDWRPGAADGVAISHSYAGGESVELNGKQPESMVLIEQRIPVTAGKSYSISWQYQLDGATGDSGLRWAVEKGAVDPPSGPLPVAASATLGGTAWQTGKFAFTSDHSGIDRLRLEYRRASETIRWKGTLQLRHVISAGAAGEPMRAAGIP